MKSPSTAKLHLLHPVFQELWLQNEKIEVIKKQFEMEKAELCQILLDAIDARDSKKIFEIAKGVEFLKHFAESGDRFRSSLLHWKQILDARGEKWPIRVVAKTIDWPDMKSQDGFSQLRRLCKEINFPLAPSRQIKRK